MSSEIQVYRDLQRRLDKLPIGFPKTESGVEIRILQHLFTPEEARIAIQLSMMPEPLSRIYKRVRKTGMSKEELERVLDHMVDKGAIWLRPRGDEKYYFNAVLAIGMYELQVDRLTKEFHEDFLQYLDEGFADEVARTRIPQLRTIPVEKSVQHEYRIGSYDNLRQIVENVDGQIAVANCVCRQGMDLIGQRCSKTDLRETCLIFRSSAQHWINLGIGRAISKEEALDILEQAQDAGLVLQPGNSQKPENICCCCGDCCGILTSAKKFPRPAELFATNYYATVDTESCTGCEMCIDRCQLDAITVVDSVAEISRDRCIGCGNCVVLCTEGAIRLHEKEKQIMLPKTTVDLYRHILAKRVGKWNTMKTGVRMMLGLRA